MSQINQDLFNNSPLAIITRPDPEGNELTEYLNQAGISACHLPLFTIEKGADLPHLQSVLDRLSPDDSVISVSPQVSHILKNHQPAFNFPSTLRYFAVGERSATLFSQLTGKIVHYPPQENSEGLLALLQKSDSLKNRKVVILRGETGRDLLGKTLTTWGAHVDYLECYFRRPIHYSPTILAPKKSNITKLIIVITSVNHLIQFEKICQFTHKQEAQLIVTSARILVKAKQLGWQHIYLTESVNNKILVKTIIALCHNDKR